MKGTGAATAGLALSGYGAGLTSMAMGEDQKADKGYVIKLGYYNKVLLGKKPALGTDPEKKIAERVTFTRKVGLPAESKHYETFNMRDGDEFLALKTGSLDGHITCDPWGSYAEFDKCGRIVPEFTVTRVPSGKWGLCCVLAMKRC